jgi:hypothetical protein
MQPREEDHRPARSQEGTCTTGKHSEVSAKHPKNSVTQYAHLKNGLYPKDRKHEKGDGMDSSAGESLLILTVSDQSLMVRTQDALYLYSHLAISLCNHVTAG